MSIASEISNLAANRDAIKAAIEAKNPSTAPTNALSSFPAAIASIQTGSNASPIAQLYGWPDIKALLDADTEDFAHKAYVLFDASVYPTVSYICAMSEYTILGDAEKAITSDGATYTTASMHTWDTTKLIDGRYGWIAFYSSQKFKRMSVGNGRSYNANRPMVLWIAGNTGIDCPNVYGYSVDCQYAYSLKAIEFRDPIIKAPGGTRCFFSATALMYVPGGFDFTGCTSVAGVFSQNQGIEEITSVGNLSSCTNAQGFFQGCMVLRIVPSVMDFSHCTSVSFMFYNCTSLTRLPDALDFSSAASNGQSNVFAGCHNVTRMPTHVTTNWSLSFSDMDGISDKDSVATFTNGAITGGFVYNLNTCTNSGQTITLNSAIKGLFDATEQAAIEAAMTAKNWTLSW